VCAVAAFVVSQVTAFVGNVLVRRPPRHVAAYGRNGLARIAVHAAPQALQARPSLSLIREQNKAGHEFRDLGARLEAETFEATAFDGKVRVVVDGLQRPRSIAVEEGAIAAAGGDNEAFAKAVLGAMQEAHDKSKEATERDVWKLYQDNSVLMQAPLTQIGAGGTVQDLWANVTATEETVQLATELFEKFDADGDGWWNQAETSAVQMATEGTDMADDAFNALLLAAAPNGGRDLTEEDLAKGLSREQVIRMYTDAQHQRQLGFVLDVRRDHAAVFDKKDDNATAPEEATSEGVQELD